MERYDHIISILRTILGHLGVVVTDITCEADEKTKIARIIIATTDSAVLIGERGDRLLALNHIVKKIVEHENSEGEEVSFLIDVNDYQKRRIDSLRSKAHMLAERARYFKSSVEMEPMSSYERMIVHAEFSETPDIMTESSGKGKERHVVLKYTESKSFEGATTL